MDVPSSNLPPPTVFNSARGISLSAILPRTPAVSLLENETWCKTIPGPELRVLSNCAKSLFLIIELSRHEFYTPPEIGDPPV